MGRTKNKKFRSYRDKKSQKIKFRIYFIRMLVLLLFYSIFTIFIAIPISVNSDSMEPSISKGSFLILLPSKNLNSVIPRQNIKSFRRGEIVLTGTNYIVDASIIQNFLDPIVRIFTLQKESILYDNSSYKGRAELLRIVGIPGDTIKINDSTVYIKPEGEDFFLSEFELTEVDYDINKKIYSENWKKEYPFSSEFKEQFIPEGSYFLISDNRGVKNDSRVFGLIDKNKIKGRIPLKYWPIDEFKFY